MNDAELLAAASALAGEPLTALDVVRGGGNNRLYRAHGARRSFALKRYPDDAADARERYEREFGALAFLWRHGERRIPEPLALDRTRGLALYGWIDGARVVARSSDDIDALAAFAAGLHDYRTRAGAAALADAREAVPAPAELAAQLRRRLVRLERVTAAHPELIALLAEIDAAVNRAAGTATEPLPPAARTLSPSDFGLHNALRTAGGLVFLDFEYFGWDDPVKLVADVLWHPGMALDDSERQRFFSRLADVYGVDRSFRARFQRDVSLYGLRWALIVLNEYLPELWQRRVESGESAPRAAVLERQFAKARAFVERARTGALLA